jgi:hypothetical protein
MNVLNKLCNEKSIYKMYDLLYLLPLNILNEFVDIIRKNIDKIPENKIYLTENVLTFYANKDKHFLKKQEKGFEDFDEFEDDYLYTGYDKKHKEKYMLEDLVEQLEYDKPYVPHKKVKKLSKPKIRDMPTIEEMNAENEREEKKEREILEKYTNRKIKELDDWYMLFPDKINDNLSLEEQYNNMEKDKKKIKEIEDMKIAEQKEKERTKYRPKEHKEQTGKKIKPPLKLTLNKDDIIEKIENLIEHTEHPDKYGIIHKKRFDIAPLYKKILLDILNNLTSTEIAEKHNIDKSKIHKIIKRVKAFFSKTFQGVDIDVIKKQKTHHKKKEKKEQTKENNYEIKDIKPYQNPDDIEIIEKVYSDEEENEEFDKEFSKYIK